MNSGFVEEKFEADIQRIQENEEIGEFLNESHSKAHRIIMLRRFCFSDHNLEEPIKLFDEWLLVFSSDKALLHYKGQRDHFQSAIKTSIEFLSEETY
jgi:hypothetical protein